MEFAIVVPVLVSIVIAIATLAPLELANNVMRDAVSQGANYVMSGGTDAATIKNVTVAAWAGYSNSIDSVGVSQYGTCAAATGSCASLCANATVAQGFASASASSCTSLCAKLTLAQGFTGMNACSSLCPDLTVAKCYTNITATSAYTPPMYGSSQTLTADETIRTR